MITLTPIEFTASVSSTRSITSALDVCSINCNIGEVEVIINPNEYTFQEKQPVLLQSSSGDLLGSLIIPEFIGGYDDNSSLQLEANFILRESIQNNDNIGEVIVDITLSDDNGMQIKKLEEPLTICLTESSKVRNSNESFKSKCVINNFFRVMIFVLDIMMKKNKNGFVKMIVLKVITLNIAEKLVCLLFNNIIIFVNNQTTYRSFDIIRTFVGRKR